MRKFQDYLCFLIALLRRSHFAEDFEDSVGFGWTASHPPHSWKTLVSSKVSNCVFREVCIDSCE